MSITGGFRAMSVPNQLFLSSNNENVSLPAVAIDRLFGL